MSIGVCIGIRYTLILSTLVLSSLILYTGVLWGQLGPASGQSAPDREGALASVRAKIGGLEVELQRLSGQADDLLGRAARNRIELRLQEARVKEATTALAGARLEIAEAVETISKLVAQVEQVRADLEGRLVRMHRYGGRGYLRFFLAADKDSNPIEALRTLRFLVRRDDRALSLYRSTNEELVRERGLLKQREIAAVDWLQNENRRRRQLLSLRGRDRTLMEQLSRRRERLRVRVDELGQKELRLERLMAALLDEGAAPLSGVPIQELRGALAWPAEGEVRVEFGPRRDPRYGTTVPHNGLELGAEPGSSVTAVYPGRVLFAAPFQDLGYTIVVQHAGEVLTLYAGLAELVVEEGDVLSLEAVVGRSGVRLYFEIRVLGRPEDPRNWLL